MTQRTYLTVLALVAIASMIPLIVMGLGLPPRTEAAELGGSAGIRGLATWYDAAPGEAAAGPTLRDALGPRWRGRVVKVTTDQGSVLVRLTDWCACGDRGSVPTLIDLPRSDFAQLGRLGRGVLPVEVSWGLELVPATDTE